MTTAATSNPIREALGVGSPAETLKWLNCLFHGEPGAGKTYMLGTAQDHADTSPVLIIDVEGGTTTLRHRKDIDVVQVRSIAELNELYTKLHESIDPKKQTMYYKSVGIDSLTELQKVDMVDIMRETIQKRPDQDPDVPSLREWGKTQEHMRKIVRAFRDLPCNTFFTAHTHPDKDSDNITMFRPQLGTTRLRQDIPGFLDIVGFLSTKTADDHIVRQLQLVQTRRVIAKDRTGALGDMIDDPSIPLMWKKINESN